MEVDSKCLPVIREVDSKCLSSWEVLFRCIHCVISAEAVN